MRNVYTVGIVCSGYLYTVYIIYRYISDYFIGSNTEYIVDGVRVE